MSFVYLYSYMKLAEKHKNTADVIHLMSTSMQIQSQ